MEAMACGCCVVASSAGGNPELVTDGVTGLLFPAGDAFALAERLRRLIGADPQLRLSLSAAAAAHAHRCFSTGASIARISEIYTELLDACDGRPRA
jgi:glycosyltransferase involved in cell wall biosynthesis